ncbi:MAG: hypothetical protein WDW36_003954 [Sanguina aurantia]
MLLGHIREMQQLNSALDGLALSGQAERAAAEGRNLTLRSAVTKLQGALADSSEQVDLRLRALAGCVSELAALLGDSSVSAKWLLGANNLQLYLQHEYRVVGLFTRFVQTLGGSLSTQLHSTSNAPTSSTSLSWHQVSTGVGLFTTTAAATAAAAASGWQQQPPGSDGAGDAAQATRDYPVLFEMGRVRDAACRGEQEHVLAGARLAGLEAEVSETARLEAEAAVVAGMARPVSNGPSGGGEGGEFLLKRAGQQVADLTLERDRVQQEVLPLCAEVAGLQENTILLADYEEKIQGQALSAARKSILVGELLAQASRLVTLRSLMSDETLSLQHLGALLQDQQSALHSISHGSALRSMVYVASDKRRGTDPAETHSQPGVDASDRHNTHASSVGYSGSGGGAAHAQHLAAVLNACTGSPADTHSGSSDVPSSEQHTSTPIPDIPSLPCGSAAPPHAAASHSTMSQILTNQGGQGLNGLSQRSTSHEVPWGSSSSSSSSSPGQDSSATTAMHSLLSSHSSSLQEVDHLLSPDGLMFTSANASTSVEHLHRLLFTGTSPSATPPSHLRSARSNHSTTSSGPYPGVAAAAAAAAAAAVAGSAPSGGVQSGHRDGAALVVLPLPLQQPEITSALVDVQGISERVTVKINEAVAKYGSLDALIKSAPEAYSLSRSVLKLFLQRPEELEARMETLQQKLALLMDV